MFPRGFRHSCNVYKVYECNDHVSHICCLVKEFRFSPININNIMPHIVQINSLKSYYLVTALKLSMQGSRGDGSL